ncbi:MAG: FAD-binding oxidoreductase [Planctomycetota bacterium]
MAWIALVTIVGCGIGFRFVCESLSRREEAFWRSKSRDFQRSMLERSTPREEPSETDVSQASPKAKRRWRNALVVCLNDESPSCRSFVLAPEDGGSFADFHGGQAILVGLEHPTNQKRVTRFYSLSGPPGLNQYRITVKRVPDGLVSNLLHDTIRVGDVIEIQEPKGKFTSDIKDTRPLVLIAAGIGITPILSMTLECFERRSTRPIRIFYQLRNSQDAPFLSLLREFSQSLLGNSRFELHVWWSRPIEGDVARRDSIGRLDAKSILDQTGSCDGEYMICGPDSFMTSLAEGLVSQGVAEADVKYESFGGTKKGVGGIAVEEDAPQTPIDGPSFDVRIEDRQLKWQPHHGTLLELAEMNDVEVESSCREGDCGACVRRLISGQVSYETDPSCDRESDEAVLCVARPVSDLHLDGE